jgi:hypothetical protein
LPEEEAAAVDMVAAAAAVDMVAAAAAVDMAAAAAALATVAAALPTAAAGAAAEAAAAEVAAAAGAAAAAAAGAGAGAVAVCRGEVATSARTRALSDYVGRRRSSWPGYQVRLGQRYLVCSAAQAMRALGVHIAAEGVAKLIENR